MLAASDLVVTTYGLLGRDLDVLADVAWATVVLDEAQFVKNPAAIGRAVRKLHAGQRIALTGTPVENRLSELWAILDWVNPGMLGSARSSATATPSRSSVATTGSWPKRPLPR